MSGERSSLNSPNGLDTLRVTDKKIPGYTYSKTRQGGANGLYESLNVARHEIRLLHIKSSSKLEEEPYCSLKTVSLDDNPRFEALSYSWGEPDLTRPIKLENREWYATINLEAGLRYLRSPSQDIVIWVDALCIDGSSVEERNSQVLLMKTIYSNAERVRIWLGEPTRGSDDALAVLEYSGRGVPFSNIRLDNKRLNDKHAKYLSELINRPWWNRVWVQQEYLLAKDIRLHCGFRSVDLAPILKAGDMSYFVRGWEKRLSSCMRTISDSGYLHSYSRPNRTGAYGLEFAEIVARGCFKYCTDLRDSIYGFLGLAPEALADAIKPDYSIPFTEVLRRTAVKHISCTRHLSFFTFTTLKSRNERLLPTWAPDWPRLGPVQPGSPGSPQNLKRRQWHFRILRFKTFFNFKACAARLLSFNSVNENTVTLNGKYSGEVTNVSPDTFHCDPSGTFSSRHIIKVIESWLEFFDVFRDHTVFPSSSEGRGSSFWRILICDHYLESTRTQFRTCNQTDYEAYEAMRRELLVGHLKSQVARDYREGFMIASAGRRLFATDRGYIGLGPPEMQRGDYVYILSGGNVPYILRPITGPRPRTFELVGDCYLHGVMYGEAAGTDEDYYDVYLE